MSSSIKPVDPVKAFTEAFSGVSPMCGAELYQDEAFVARCDFAK